MFWLVTQIIPAWAGGVWRRLGSKELSGVVHRNAWALPLRTGRGQPSGKRCEAEERGGEEASLHLFLCCPVVY